MATEGPTTADKLLATLQEVVPDRRLRFEGEPAPLSGGFFAEMLRFRLSDPPPGLGGDLVARIMPTENVGAWEATIQRHVAAAGFPTPTIRLTAGPASPLGRFLIVMDHAAGRPPLDGLGPTTILRQLPRLVTRLPRSLAQITAQLHVLDPEPLGAELAGLDGDFPQTSADFVGHQARQATVSGRSDLVAAAERLLATEPDSPERVICHGDLHPFNLLAGGDQLTLVDWSVARIAHPTFDLAFTELMLANPPISLPGVAAKVLRPATRRIADQFLRDYAVASGRHIDPAALVWHRGVHALRILVEVAGWDAAGARPADHPWLLLEPAARAVLGLSPGLSQK